MDKSTYERKLTAYKLSDASIEQKERAIEALNSQFYGTTSQKMKDLHDFINQSQAELKSDEYSA